MIDGTPLETNLASATWPRCSVLAEPRAVRAARNFVAEQLGAYRLHDYVHPAQLIMSELATNAVKISRPGDVITVGVAVARQAITMLCWDAHHAMPEAQPAAALDEGGRGLQIVACLAKEWGVIPLVLEPGKVVWATLDRSDQQ